MYSELTTSILMICVIFQVEGTLLVYVSTYLCFMYSPFPWHSMPTNGFEMVFLVSTVRGEVKPQQLTEEINFKYVNE